jgi:hypothetical protein
MRNGIAFIAIMFFAYVAQTSLLPPIFLFVSRIPGLGFLLGHTLNFVTMTLFYLSLNRDLSGTLIWATVYGMVGNWFGIAWNGAFASALFMTAVLCHLLKSQLLLKDAAGTALFAGALFFVEGLIHLLLGHLLQQIQVSLRYQLLPLLVYTILNALAAPVVFTVLRQIDIWTDGISLRTRGTLEYRL